MNIHPTDPDEFCTHCYRPVCSLYRLCPWCGEVWDSGKYIDTDEQDQARQESH